MTRTEQLGQKAAEAGARATNAAAAASARVGEAATQAGADFGRTASDQAQAIGGEFVRMFADFRLPGLPDVQGLMDAQRRNLEAISAANRVAVEGAQAVARRQSEIMQSAMRDLGETMRQFASPDAPQARAAKHADLIKSSYERAVENARELRELIQRANGEALELLNSRFAEAMDEIKAAMQRSQSQARPV